MSWVRSRSLTGALSLCLLVPGSALAAFDPDLMRQDAVIGSTGDGWGILALRRMDCDGDGSLEIAVAASKTWMPSPPSPFGSAFIQPMFSAQAYCESSPTGSMFSAAAGVTDNRQSATAIATGDGARDRLIAGLTVHPGPAR